MPDDSVIECRETMKAPANAPEAIVRNGRVRCNRRPLWWIRGIGYFCHAHYENYLMTHEVDSAQIIRLSSDDRDFVVKAEPGLGHNHYTARKAKEATGRA